MHLRTIFSTYRNSLKGIAILWICFFHARLGLENVPVIGAIQQIGYLGVDIFLLLSGMGLYHSLNKSPSMWQYLRRRAVRLLPAFLPVCIGWCIVMIPALGLNTGSAIHTALGSLTMLGYLTGAPYILNWYLTLLLITILLAPLLYKVLHNARKPYWVWELLILAAFACGIPMVGRSQMMLFSRLPIFVLGFGLSAVEPKKDSPVLTAVLCWFGFFIGAILLWLGFAWYPHWQIGYGLYWYPALLMIPGLCAGLCWLMNRLSATGIQFRGLNLLGKASFEIFLFNGWFELLCKRVLKVSDPLANLFWMLLSIVLGLLWHWLLTVVKQKKKQTA